MGYRAVRCSKRICTSFNPASTARLRSSPDVFKEKPSVEGTQSIRSEKGANAFPKHDIEGLPVEGTPYVQ